ncbi:MAG: glycosyltransferase family 2 protein [Acaryochloris sp. RU_4_1]|nr:glycosyltransferase family 2 protein [Acaryochloris sp. RU_4_1]NJR53452.1 glycosyltransferase family 2 protein [Acaryochloris sp. CRU_2_0]
MPTVSVIIPVYNSERTVAATMDSVLAQTFTDFEILVIDDGGCDRSIEICQSYSDSRIRIIHQQNRGLAGARNTGIRHAQGQYLAFLDSDDLWQPEKLAKHIEHFQRHPDIGVSFCRSSFIDEQGQPLGIYQMPKLTDITPGYLFCRNPISNGSAVVIRREVLEDIKFQASLYGDPEDFYFDDSFRQSEDIECWLRIALKSNWKIAGIPDALTLYRVNMGGLSANILKQYEAWERIITKTQAEHPDFVHQWADKARAYQLRYLARRAASQRSPTIATQLLHKALATDWTILREEPRRTLLTIGAVYFLRLLPPAIYQQLETVAMRITGLSQRRRIQQEQRSA